MEINAAEHGYEWDPTHYNTFTQSQWMTADKVALLKRFAEQVNARAKLRVPGMGYPGFVGEGEMAA